MKADIEAQIQAIFHDREVYPAGSYKPVYITDVKWNGQMDHFIVQYKLSESTYTFHYDKNHDASIHANPVEQLKAEVAYVIRMCERGIGAKAYYPCTTITLR
ncbi:hypothetical protein [Priestia koreensis]|uniref:Uncharacterized protein n=1 Tax=Priestia koreensis TaxID=284581 RepID=A0A0M0KV74_9BACI|nr:hypothetical protein [Priestia koreensis]KOO42721.1 hypothetical protein AMD01_16370 [Priestia koreensis]MCM3005535.1 hypothetical protein [Priestia koreensis]